MDKFNKPDFLVVGAAKSGTTSLFHYLNQHPKIVGLQMKRSILNFLMIMKIKFVEIFQMIICTTMKSL